MALEEITFATDEELQRYESEIVEQAADRGVTLDHVRALAKSRITREAVRFGVDLATVVDDGSVRAEALRDYGTRLALQFYWEDQATGREGSATEGKAERARRAAAEARETFFAIGWPVDLDADDAIGEGELRPSPRETSIALGSAPVRKVFVP